MELFQAILNAFNFIRTTSQLEYFIRSKDPKTHAEVEQLVRDFYSMKSL